MKTEKLILLFLIFAAAAIFFYFDLQRFLSIEQLKANREALSRFTVSHGVAAAILFIAIYVIQTALSLPGAAVLSLAAGAIFGPAFGTLYALAGATMGAALAFLAARYLLRDLVLHRFGARLEGLNRELEKRGLGYLLFLRLVPVFPFFLVNLAAALTRLPFRTFLAGTSLGIIPGAFVYVNAGASLSTIHSLSEVASPRVLGAFALLGLLAVVPSLYQRIKERRD